ncbi:MAG: hypothetical protein Q8N03_07585 [Ignavibacteria bacterium]|nr:hypothetical protein [Ignavibacteria bacterium]
MKKRLTLWRVLIFSLLSFTFSTAQIHTFRLNVFTPLPQLDFATFAVTNDLQGAPTVFSVEILPADELVIFEGSFEWKDVGEAGYTFFTKFRTRPFRSRVFFNNTLGSEIRIESSENNSNRITQALRKGKPTGNYILTLKLFKENGSPYIDPSTGQQFVTSAALEFLNPTQTLEILLPIPSTLQDVGQVIAKWTPVQGASKYFIKASLRRDNRTSLENALSSGQVLINNVEAKDPTGQPTTEINLRNLLTGAEWFGGQEVVFQVTAFVEGPSGGQSIFSNLVNFYLKDANTMAYMTLVGNIVSIMQSLPGGVIPQSLINDFISGALQITGIKRDDGSDMPISEVMALFNYLAQNPGERVVSATFNQ